MRHERLFGFDVSRRGAYVVVHPEGELDIAAVPALCARVRQAADRSPRIVVDLRDVTFMDTFALRALVALQVEAETSGGWQLHVVPGAGIQRTLDVVRGRHEIRWIAAEQLVQ